MADIGAYPGLIAAGVHPSPRAVRDFVTPTTHKEPEGAARRDDIVQGSAMRRRSNNDISGHTGRSSWCT